MPRAPMLNGMFQLRDCGVHMRILPRLESMLHGRFRTGQERPHMTLLAMVCGFLGELDRFLAMLVFRTNSITTCPAFRKHRLQGQDC